MLKLWKVRSVAVSIEKVFLTLIPGRAVFLP